MRVAIAVVVVCWVMLTVGGAIVSGYHALGERIDRIQVGSQ